jgi:hypothetical protein
MEIKMSTNVADTNGRAYASVAETKAGDVLEADGSFDCMLQGERFEVFSEGDMLYVRCDQKHHALSGQLNDAGTHYVGFYPVKP